MRSFTQTSAASQSWQLAFVKTLGKPSRLGFCDKQHLSALLRPTTQRLLAAGAMPRFDCTTAAGMRDAIAQTYRSDTLLRLPETLLNEILRQLGIKYLRRFSFVNRYALTRVRARIARLPDPDWRLGFGDRRSQATVYYRREEQTGAAWLKRYEDSIVLWDASGGARCYPRTAAAARDKWRCQVCVSPMPHRGHVDHIWVVCCGSVMCGTCRRGSANCPVCGSNLPRQRGRATAAESQLLLAQLHQHATKGSASAQAQLGTHYAFANGGYGDTPAALLWNERAARQGHAGAQFSMARDLDGLKPAFKDLPRRAEYLAMASAQHISHFVAIEELGTMYFDGEIPTPDAETRYKEAARLFKLDIETRVARYSYTQLGRCYMRGLGVPADRDEAERLWQYAVTENDDEEAAEELESNGMEVPEYGPEIDDY